MTLTSRKSHFVLLDSFQSFKVFHMILSYTYLNTLNLFDYIIDNIFLISDLIRTSVKECIFLSIYLSSSNTDLPSFFSYPITLLLIIQVLMISIKLQTSCPKTLVYPEQLPISSNSQIVLVSVFKIHRYSIVLQLEN